MTRKAASTISIIGFGSFRTRSIGACVAVAMFVFASLPQALGAGNHLDYGFGHDGTVTTNYSGSSNDEGLAVAVQLDGKVVVAGKTSAGSINPQLSTWAVMRYNVNGTLDTAFGASGKVVIDFAGGTDVPSSITLQSNGRIVVVGTARISGTNDFAIARLTAAGALDTTFGGDGKVTYDLGGDDQAHGSTLQTDGKLVVAGTGMITASSSLFALIRLNVNGYLDTTFDGNGKVATDFGGQPKAGAYDVITQPDGKLVAGGFATVTGQSMAMARYDPDGSPDAGFGSNGRVTLSPGGNGDTALTVKRMPDGKLMLLGFTHSNNPPGQLLVLRKQFLITGAGDPTSPYLGFPLFFGNTQFDAVGGIVADSAGTITFTGYTTGPGGKYFLISRFNDFEYLPLFGIAGHVFTYFGTNDASARGLALQKNGQIVVAGSYLNSSGNNDFAVARYKSRSLAVRADYQGTGWPDHVVYRPSNSTWYFAVSGTNTPWGSPGDTPVPGDYDGDSIADAAVFRPSNSTWYVLRSSNGTVSTVSFGVAGDVPVQGDFDGDGSTDIAVFRPSAGAWVVQYSFGGTATVYYGVASDKPVPADYDGDGLVDTAVFRPSTGTWNLNRSRLGNTAIQFGANGDKPVPADYDGDGMDDLAVFRPSDATWYVIRSHDGSLMTTPWGLGSDVPAPADFDHDGAADFAVFRPATGTWYELGSIGNTATVAFGQAGDVPISSAYTPQ
jgi:uncharacterized delta-60 repeat protein